MSGVGSSWPSDWVLVLHGRYGLSADDAAEFLRNHPENLFLSTEPFDSNDDLGKLLGDADIGFGLYCPDYKNQHTGLNLKHIGLASGKIATFLRFGVPVLVNNIGEMADYVARKKLGVVVSQVEDIPSALRNVTKKDLSASERCQQFFDQELSVSASFDSLLDRIDSSQRSSR